MKQWVNRYLSFFLILLLCVGCGKAPGASGDSVKEQGPGIVTSEEGSGRIYRVDKTISLEIEDPDKDFSNKTVYSGAYGSTLYLLASYRFEDAEEPAMWIYTFNLDTQKTEKAPFSLETSGMENPYIDSMYVTGQDELTFRVYGTLEGKDAVSFLYRTDLSGKPLDGENPFSEDTGYPPDTGKFVAVPDGTPFLAETGDSMNTSLSRYDMQSHRSALVAKVNGFINALCSDGQGGLYYVDSSRLRHLNLDDMTEEILCNTAECGIKLAYENWLLSDGEGKLALCSIGNSTSTVYLLTDKEALGQAETERETIRMACLHGYDYKIQLAHAWSALSDKYAMIVEEIPLEEQLRTSSHSELLQLLEPLRTRTMAELVSGQGPELMFVSEDDMHILAEKGALMDISELIPEDVKEQLLPGIRQLGTVDGEWVGITNYVWYYTLMTSDSLWSEDSWTISDILDIAESKDDWDWILSRSWLAPKPDYDDLFEVGFSRSLGDSPFMDLENGISHFNGEEFIRTLEFCKRYGETGHVSVDSSDALRTMLQDGKSIARMVYLYGGLNDYSELATSYENCHIVGFPSERGKGNYMYVEGYLVVNANAKNVDAIKDYIAYLLDYDIQFGSGASSVRRDVLRNMVTVHPESGQPAMMHPNPLDPDGAFDYVLINDLKPDGSTYLEEFMEFVENCEPVPYCPNAISEIVNEEVGAYFTGGRSAEDTANIIHRRVQLYFDER